MKNVYVKGLFVLIVAVALLGLATALNDKIVLNDPFGYSSNFESKIYDNFQGRISSDLLDYFENNQAEVVFVFEGSVPESFLDQLGREKITDFVEGSDFVAAKVTFGELYLTLNSYDNLLFVQPQRRFGVTLQDAVQMTRADDSWQVNVGEEFADGSGQSICIIDTGFDFSHPDLESKNALGDLTMVDCSGASCVLSSDLSPFDDGHGTHVAGIAGAAGDIDGIGKGANLIGVRVMNDQGVIFTTKVMRGIDWCRNNRDNYDISVISISLGTQDENGNFLLFDDYCDDHAGGLASRINSAFSEGIATVAATGNDGSSSGIVEPACVTGSIPVSAITKQGSLAGYANYNGMTKLFAPGGLAGSDSLAINSTAVGGGYEYRAGTSMSTPMVAGALAIMKQALDATDQQMNPHEMEQILFDTGFAVTDLDPGQWRSINVYEALMEILPSDLEAPSVDLISPDNGLNSVKSVTYVNSGGNYNLVSQGNFEFECSAEDNLELQNVKLYVWNPQNELTYQDMQTVEGSFADVSFDVPASTFGYVDENGVIHRNNGLYTWNCEAEDVSQNVAMASEDFSLNLFVNVIVLGGNNNNNNVKKEALSITKCSTRADCVYLN